jgi:glycosyltransferase involved in cell wall biosynthesis
VKTASIIIPFHNQLQFLDQSLRSAVAQTVKDIEIILVDDGSEQDPSDVVRLIGDDRIRVIRQENSGVANARNKAIAESVGEFVVFVDSDDWLDPAMVEKLTDELRESTEFGFAYCDIIRVDESGNPADEFSVAKSRKDLSGNILSSLLAGGYFPPVSVLVRASVLSDVGGFDQSLGGCCDWDLWIRMSAAGYKGKFLPERLAYYRLHDSSMSKDAAHMRATAVGALAKNMAVYPEQIANAMHRLIETSEAIYRANAEILTGKRWLEEQLSSFQGEYEAAAVRIKHFEQTCAELISGKEWLEGQLTAYKVAYDSSAARIATLEQHCAELLAGKDWLEGQLETYKQLLRQCEHELGSSKKSIDGQNPESISE